MNRKKEKNNQVKDNKWGERVLIGVTVLAMVTVLIGWIKWFDTVKKGPYVATIEDISRVCTSKPIKIYEKALVKENQSILLSSPLHKEEFEKYIIHYKENINPLFLIYRVTLSNGKQYTINYDDPYLSKILGKNKKILAC